VEDGKGVLEGRNLREFWERRIQEAASLQGEGSVRSGDLRPVELTDVRQL